jgi:hypothetical protein
MILTYNPSILVKHSPKALLLHLKRFAIVEKPRIQTSLSVEKERDSIETAEATKRPPAVEMTFRKNKVSVEVDISLYRATVVSYCFSFNTVV